MPARLLPAAAGAALRNLAAAAAATMAETLGTLAGRKVDVQASALELTAADELAAALPAPHSVLLLTPAVQPPGRPLRLLLPVAEASTLAGLLMLAPEAAIAERRQQQALTDEDASAFAEIAAVLGAALAAPLAPALGEGVELAVQCGGTLAPGDRRRDLLGDGPQLVVRLQLAIAGHPPAPLALVLDQAVAEAWNGGPLSAATPAPGPAAAVPEREEDALAAIPAAPIRGALNAYLVQEEPFRLLRRACRRVGLELRRFSRAEAPNPAAHRGEVVVMDVPAGDQRRLQWCRRLKEAGGGTKVLLLLQSPSRARVAQAFLAGADAILGWPAGEPQLAQKLTELLAG